MSYKISELDNEITEVLDLKVPIKGSWRVQFLYYAAARLWKEGKHHTIYPTIYNAIQDIDTHGVFKFSEWDVKDD